VTAGLALLRRFDYFSDEWIQWHCESVKNSFANLTPLAFLLRVLSIPKNKIAFKIDSYCRIEKRRVFAANTGDKSLAIEFIDFAPFPQPQIQPP
jgi:hypothetical protein